MYLYIFGSACRGELDKNSDIDMLAIHSRNENINHLDGDKLSIYSEDKIKKIWSDGNPFAWHLYSESKLVYSPNNSNFIENLKKPAPYTAGLLDCKKFLSILLSASNSFKNDHLSLIFDLSTIFLCIRNIATCFSLQFDRPIFSRNSPMHLGTLSLNIKIEVYQILEKCRLATTRGKSIQVTIDEINMIKNELKYIIIWAETLIQRIET